MRVVNAPETGRRPMSPHIRALVSSAFFIAFSLAVAHSSRAQLDLPPVPLENPLTPEKIILGKILFWEEQLSSTNTMACGTCHQPGQGGADVRFTETPGPDGHLGTDDDVYGSPGVILSDSSGRYTPSDP